MGFQRHIACAAALAAIVFAPVSAAAGDDYALNKEGFWRVGRGDADSDSCIASVPTKAGPIFMLLAEAGEVSFAVGTEKPMRRGRKGVLTTEAWRFDFEPAYTDEGDTLYLDDHLNSRAMAALRLARAVGVVIDGRTVLDAAVEGTGLEEVLDAVIDCSNGKSGWWGPGVATTDGDGKTPASRAGGSGTGFFISADGIAVTAAHVVKDCATLTSPRWGPAKVLASDPRADLAVLKTQSASGQFVPLRGRGPKLGENMSAAGYPLGQLLGSGLKITTGVVAGLAGPEGDRGLFQISAPIQPGNSGGPVVDAGGALIGVTSAKLDELKLASATGTFPQNVNFAVPVTILQSFLEENGVAYRTSPAGMAADATALTGYTFSLVCTR
jgi:S1-C subfamily serine protease